MADGIVCLHCGRYETDHELGIEEADETVPGYKVPLSACPGYHPEDEELAKRLEVYPALKTLMAFSLPSFTIISIASAAFFETFFSSFISSSLYLPKINLSTFSSP